MAFCFGDHVHNQTQIVFMRKRLTTPRPILQDAPLPDEGWLELDRAASVEVISEEKGYPDRDSSGRDLCPCLSITLRESGKEGGSLWAIVGHHLATVARNLLLFPCRDDSNFVWGQPKTFKPFRCFGSNAVAVFSDSSSKDQKVRAAQ